MMSRAAEFYRQLKQRRVIRTGVVYVALVWGALQVAELLDDAGFMSESQVQWLIFAALVGFPLTLVLSWFFETPWRGRKGIAVLGDVAVILAIVTGVSLLAWQHYFKSFSRPALAILKIEATDVNPSTPALGNYLAGQLRMVLATRPELLVLELSSSSHAAIHEFPLNRKAESLGADFLLSGTVNQAGDEIRLGLQLYDGSGRLVWSEQFEDRMLDLAPLQSAALNALWVQLPLPPDALAETRDVISTCEYPPDTDAIRTLIDPGTSNDPSDLVSVLTDQIAEYPGNGPLHLARSTAHFKHLDTASPARQPVLNNLALRDLDEASKSCPGHPEISRQRLLSTRILQDAGNEYESYLSGYPNDAQIRQVLAVSALDGGYEEDALMLARESWITDPLSEDSICLYDRVLSALESNGSAEDFRQRISRILPELELPCQ